MPGSKDESDPKRWTHPLSKVRRSQSAKSVQESVLEPSSSSPRHRTISKVPAPPHLLEATTSTMPTTTTTTTPLAVWTEDCVDNDDEGPMISASPSTPPRKVWERSYRNFLKLNKQQQPPPPISAGGHHRSRTSSLGGHMAAATTNHEDKESSVRGGKLFSHLSLLQQQQQQQQQHPPSVPTTRRKIKSMDELDETKWRGAEKTVSSIPRATSGGELLPSSANTVAAAVAASSLPRPRSHHALLASKIIVEDDDDDDDDDKQLSLSNSATTRKAFTQFHNSSTTGRDAVSAYLGDDPSHRHSSSSLAWTPSNTKLASVHKSYGNLHYHHSASLTDNHKLGSGSTSTTVSLSPLETVYEHVSIHKTLRVLKQIQSVEAWLPNRRYLIAPAALAACPIHVLTILSGGHEAFAAKQAVERGAAGSFFGTTILGPCLISCTSAATAAGGIATNTAQWSSAVLVLRQNYLLEYSAGAPLTSVPRGYAHLQYSSCSAVADFGDALELRWFGSPCAKSDQRALMIRLEQREQREEWMVCLKRAAILDIADLYEFDDRNCLGKGGYASVFAGTRKDRRKEACALKVFDKNQYWRMVVKGRERADTLVRETSVQATMTAKCGKIPSFVRIRGFFETSDNIVLELELLEGTDLFKYIQCHGVLKESTAAAILRDILVSLQAMNRIGLAHRDVKPANILMCQSQHGPTCKVADFGMSTFVGVDGQLRGRCGTPGYVAPEIFTAGLHGGYGNKVDVFSAGVTLYVMLCGYEPFYGETDAELVQANKEAVVEFPPDEWKHVSLQACQLVQHMMHPDPAKRLDATEALKHAWFETQLGGPTALDVSMSLPIAEAPADDACVIS